jgi:hypothetical protein
MTEWLPDIERALTGIIALVAAVASIINARSIKQVHVSINSRMDQLLKLQAEASKAEGAADERANPTPPRN